MGQLQTIDSDDDDEPTCRVCGCTEDRACPGGCWWVADVDEHGDLCSQCQQPRRSEAS